MADDNVEVVASIRTEPVWRDYGLRIPADATAKEAAEACGLNWHIHTSALFDDEGGRVEGHRLVYREVERGAGHGCASVRREALGIREGAGVLLQLSALFREAPNRLPLRPWDSGGELDRGKFVFVVLGPGADASSRPRLPSKERLESYLFIWAAAPCYEPEFTRVVMRPTGKVILGTSPESAGKAEGVVSDLETLAGAQVNLGQPIGGWLDLLGLTKEDRETVKQLATQGRGNTGRLAIDWFKAYAELLESQRMGKKAMHWGILGEGVWRLNAARRQLVEIVS